MSILDFTLPKDGAFIMEAVSEETVASNKTLAEKTLDYQPDIEPMIIRTEEDEQKAVEAVTCKNMDNEFNVKRIQYKIADLLRDYNDQIKSLLAVRKFTMVTSDTKFEVMKTLDEIDNFISCFANKIPLAIAKLAAMYNITTNTTYTQQSLIATSSLFAKYKEKIYGKDRFITFPQKPHSTYYTFSRFVIVAIDQYLACGDIPSIVNKDSISDIVINDMLDSVGYDNIPEFINGFCENPDNIILHDMYGTFTKNVFDMLLDVTTPCTPYRNESCDINSCLVNMISLVLKYVKSKTYETYCRLSVPEDNVCDDTVNLAMLDCIRRCANVFYIVAAMLYVITDEIKYNVQYKNAIDEYVKDVMGKTIGLTTPPPPSQRSIELSESVKEIHKEFKFPLTGIGVKYNSRIFKEDCHFPIKSTKEYYACSMNGHPVSMTIINSGFLLFGYAVAGLSGLGIMSAWLASAIATQCNALDIVTWNKLSGKNDKNKHVEILNIRTGRVLMVSDTIKKNDPAIKNILTLFGNCVIVQHSLFEYSLYAHLSKISCKRNDKLKRGDRIGYMGSTGNSSEPHLHIQMSAINPSLAVKLGIVHQMTTIPPIAFLTSVPLKFSNIEYKQVTNGLFMLDRGYSKFDDYPWIDSSDDIIKMNSPKDIFIVKTK